METTKDSEVQGVCLPRFGNVGLERPRNKRIDERVAYAEVSVYAELLLDALEAGVVSQAGCDLSAVFDRKQAMIAVALLEHEVFCLTYLFGGGTEGGPGICEASFVECRIGIVFLSVFFGLGVLDVCSNESVPGEVVGFHDGRCFSV